MPPASRRALVVLAAWTLFVWGTRVRNALGDDDLGGGELIAALGLAGSFVALALGLVAAVARRSPLVAPVTHALAAWTAAVWAVRATAIAAGDHEAAFVVVHLLLAVVSVGLAWVAVRAVARSRAAVGSAPAPADR